MKLPAPIPGDTKFFRAFSRFEQVLKASGYYKRKPERRGRPDGEPNYPEAAPDWDRFANEQPEIQDLLNDPKLDPAIEYLAKDPPWHEVVKDGALSFQQKQGEIRTTHDLLLAVRRVRNNLFHGAKTPLGPMNDPVRNQELIRGCMAVLREILKRCPNVSQKFDAYDW